MAEFTQFADLIDGAAGKTANPFVLC